MSDLHYNQDTSNYSLQVIRNDKVPAESARHFQTRILLKEDFRSDTLNVRFSTGGGIDTLVFVLRNNDSGEEVTISALSLSYDTPYYIIIPAFVAGSYLFDWDLLTDCNREQLKKKKVKCNGKQYALLRDNKGVMPWSVVPSDLSHFRIVR